MKKNLMLGLKLKKIRLEKEAKKKKLKEATKIPEKTSKKVVKK